MTKIPITELKSDNIKQMIYLIRQAYNKLTVREKRILELRLGLCLDIPKTLKEVSRQFSVSSERIRGIEIKAFEKIEDDWQKDDDDYEIIENIYENKELLK